MAMEKNFPKMKENSLFTVKICENTIKPSF
jgi:hypothetical protein